MNQNQLKKISSLSHAKYRKLHGLFIAEGAHIVHELLKSDWQPQTIIIIHELAGSNELSSILKTVSSKKITIESITRREYSKLSATESPQGILAIVKIPQNDLRRLATHKKILIADGISDPGNLGMIIRTAAAFGLGGIVTTPGSADIFNPKTVRASQGALFHPAVANHIETEEIIRVIKPNHKIYALSAMGQSDLRSFRPAARYALVIGAEIAGVSKEFLDISDRILRIPISERVESLNAAMAAGIAMYEFSKTS
jgi:TrmH family RNA methyltransferase